MCPLSTCRQEVWKCSVSWCVSTGTPGQGSGHEARKEQGKGGRRQERIGVEKDVADSGDTVPLVPPVL